MSGYDVIKGKDPNGYFVFVAVDENGYLKVVQQGSIDVGVVGEVQVVSEVQVVGQVSESRTMMHYDDEMGGGWIPLIGDSNGVKVNIIEPVTLNIGTNLVGDIGLSSRVKNLGGTLDTNPYSDGDVIFSMVFDVGVINYGKRLLNFSVIDIDGNAGKMDCYFFTGQVSMGNQNDAAVLNAADAPLFLGKISVDTSDYEIISSIAIAALNDFSIVLEGYQGDGILTMIVVSRDTKTYTSDGLVFRLGLV